MKNIAIIFILLIFVSCNKNTKQEKKIPILSTRPLKVPKEKTGNKSQPQKTEVKVSLTPQIKLKLARKSFVMGDIPKAIKLFTEVQQIKKLPKKMRLEALAGLAESYFNLHEYEKALVNWQKVVALSSKQDINNLSEEEKYQLSVARHNMALTYERLGKNDKSLAELKEALKVFPDNLIARLDYISMLKEFFDEGKIKLEKNALENEFKAYELSRKRLLKVLKIGEDKLAMIRAITILNQVPDPEAIPSDIVIPLLDHKTPEIRIGAGYVAAKFPRGKDELKKRLPKEKDPRVKEAWQEALKYIAPLNQGNVQDKKSSKKVLKGKK